MNIEDVRNLFPYLKTGKIYFNHASTGPISQRVLDAVNSFLTTASQHKIDDYLSVINKVEDTKKELGGYINCNPERIAFLDNTTNGINIIASGIDWKKGDRIVLNDVEFPANVYPFMNQQKKGVEIDFVKSVNGAASAEDIIAAIQPATRLVSVSQVQFLSGYRVELGKISEVCRERGIIFCVDAIQGLGAIRLDVQKDKIDYLASGVQKWMLGFQGLAFIYISEELQRQMSPAYAGWLSVKDAWKILDFNMESKNTAEAFQYGTLNTLGIFGLNASIKLFRDFGYNNVEQRVLDNSEYLIQQLVSIGINPMINMERKYLSGIVSFRHNDVQRIFEAVEKENINCAVREGIFRIAPHFYNTYEEIDRLIEVLKRLI